MTQTEPAPNPSTPGTTPGPSALRTWLLRGVIAVLLILAAWYIGWMIDWKTVGVALETIKLVWLPVAIAATLFAHLARAIRWRELIPGGKSISILNAFSATIIGYLMNNVIPRSGELGRPYVLARRENRPTSELLATVVVERMLDGISLLLIFISLLFTTAGDRLDLVFPEYPISTIMRLIALPLIALIVILFVVVKTTLGEKLLAKVEKKLPAKLHGRLLGLLGDFRHGISVGGARGGLAILFWTVAIWLGYAMALYFGILAFSFDTAYGLGPDDALVVLAITAVGITIAPTPGGFGVFHGFCTAALRTLYAVPDGPGVAFAIVTHATPYLTVMVLGAYFLLREKISFREISRQKVQPRSTP
jgi:glycosyltransferase 2 family protein